MAKVKVIVTTEDGEVLEQFTAESAKIEESTWLANQVRDVLEHRFNVEDAQ